MIAWLAAVALGAEPVTLWYAYSGAEEQALLEAIAALPPELGPVEASPVAFSAYDGKLEAAIPRGNGPDVFIAGHSNLGKWTAMGLIDPVEGELVDLTGLGAVQSGGRTWGVPLSAKSLVLLYDPTVVATPPATTDELVALALRLKAEGKYGLAVQAGESYYHAPWVHGFGGESMREGVAQLDTPGQVAAYGFVQRLAVELDLLPAQPTAELMTRLYNEGKAPLVISGPWFVADLARPVAAALLPVVSETGRRAEPFVTVEAAFVAAGSTRRDRAFGVSRALAVGEPARIRAEKGRQAVTWKGYTSTDPLLAVLQAQAAEGIPIPTDPQMGALFESQNRSLRRLLRGVVDPAEAAREAAHHDRILSKPPPPAVEPWPYVLVLGLLSAVGLVWLGRPLGDGGFRSSVWAHRWDYVWVAPAMVSMTALVGVPFVVGSAVSLLAHDQGTWRFVGFQQFTRVLLSTDFPIWGPQSFWYTLVVTVVWTVANVSLHVAIGMAVAMLLREPWIRMRGLFRALLILPWAIPNYITALLWKGMFHAQFGAVNAMLAWVSGGPVEYDWFSSFSTAFAANLVTNTWLGFPFMMVVTLGALQSIPRELEEAAELDGAGAFARFRHVTWPLLQPALLPAVILGSVWTFNLFNVIYLVSGGEPDGSTEILISEAYRWAFSRGNRYGYAAAYAVVIFIVLLGYSRLANRLVGRKVL